MNALEVLTKAKQLLSDPDKWYQGGYSCDAKGIKQQTAMAPSACKWCSVGALCVVEGVSGATGLSSGALSYLGDAIQKGGARSIVDFNDNKSTTHQDVMNAFDKAIVNALNDNNK